MARIFSQPPFRFLARHLAEDSEFIEDAKRILALDENNYSRLVQALVEAEGFLDHSQIENISEKALGSNTEASRIGDVVHRLSRLLRDADMPVSEAMDQLAEAIWEHAEEVESSDRHRLAKRLRGLVVDPSGLDRQHKATQLVGATGGKLGNFQIICDIRPIFDEQRQQIDGAIPVSTLRFDHTAADGESKVSEFHITEEQINELGQVLEVAKRKLRAAKAQLVGSNVTIPKTKATIHPDED